MTVPKKEGYTTVSDWCANHNKKLTYRGLKYNTGYIYRIIKENEDAGREKTIFKGTEMWFEYIVVGEQKNYLIKI